MSKKESNKDEELHSNEQEQKPKAENPFDLKSMIDKIKNKEVNLSAFESNLDFFKEKEEVSITECIAKGDTEKAIDVMTRLAGRLNKSYGANCALLSARYSTIRRKVITGLISTEEEILQMNRINNSILEFSKLIEQDLKTTKEGKEPSKFIINVRGEAETITLTFKSIEKRINETFEIPLFQTVDYLKHALINHFKIERPPHDFNSDTNIYLIANHKVIKNDNLTLYEAGIKSNDEIQLQIEVTQRKMYHEMPPGQLVILLEGFKFKTPRLVIGDTQSGLLFLLDENKAGFVFYDNIFEAEKSNYKFRFIDMETYIEFEFPLFRYYNSINLDKIPEMQGNTNK
ncbi:MAG: hypothetical protein AAFV95_28430 [Bacteroidota bacterium]